MRSVIYNRTISGTVWRPTMMTGRWLKCQDLEINKIRLGSYGLGDLILFVWVKIQEERYYETWIKRFYHCTNTLFDEAVIVIAVSERKS